jgi:uncharacterized surface protein with fasciclin (FAS1) repeats
MPDVVLPSSRADTGLYGIAPYGAYYRPYYPQSTVVVVGRKLAQAPAAAAGECKTADQVLASTPSLSRLSQLTQKLAAPLKADLSTRAGPAFTFFAPSDAALQMLLSALPDASAGQPELVRNTTALTALLSYHLVPGSALPASQLSDAKQLQTALGSAVPPLRVRRSGTSVAIVGVGSEAAVTQTDLVTCRGVIHIIDTVLLPVASSEKQGLGSSAGG